MPCCFAPCLGFWVVFLDRCPLFFGLSSPSACPKHASKWTGLVRTGDGGDWHLVQDVPFPFPFPNNGGRYITRVFCGSQHKTHGRLYSALFNSIRFYYLGYYLAMIIISNHVQIIHRLNPLNTSLMLTQGTGSNLKQNPCQPIQRGGGRICCTFGEDSDSLFNEWWTGHFCVRHTTKEAIHQSSIWTDFDDGEMCAIRTRCRLCPHNYTFHSTVAVWPDSLSAGDQRRPVQHMQPAGPLRQNWAQHLTGRPQMKQLNHKLRFFSLLKKK